MTIDLDDLLVRGDPARQHPDLRQRPDQRPGHRRGHRLLPGRGGASPGALAFKSTERITLLAAIAHAGGLTDRASSKILIKRGGQHRRPAEITVDYKKILAGKEPDVDLRQGDVIVVKESFF